MNTPEFLTPAEAAALLGIRIETLCRWRTRGYGPEYFRSETGRWVRYRRSAVDAWLASRAA